MRKPYLYFLVISICFSCQNKKGIELELLNDQIIAYCPNDDCSKVFGPNSKKDYYRKANNVIKFKITNYDKKAYVIMPLCIDPDGYNCSFYNSFPERLMSINYNNIIIHDANGNLVQKDIILTNNSYSERDIYSDYKDSISNIFYDKIGYNNKSENWKTINSQIINNMIIVHPKEVLYFETYTSIPVNYNIASSLLETLSLNPKNNYKVKLEFKNEIENLEELLTELQLKTFKENNYELYNGDLISINSAPIKFVNK